MRVESALVDEVGVDSGGGEGAVFESATEDNDRIGVGNGVVDDPGVGGGAQQRGAENKAESGEQDYETTGPKDDGPQAARPLAAGRGWLRVED